MQVKRFVADDMRTAMRLVKEEIGSDAVILSNRVMDGKVEILAARDYDESLINKALDKTLLESRPDSAAAYYERAAAERELEQTRLQDSTQKKIQAEEAEGKNKELNSPTTVVKEAETTNEVNAVSGTNITPELTQNTQHQASGLYKSAAQVQAPLNDSMLEMRDELKSLRAMIENQNVLGEWNELALKHPLRMSLYKRLTEMGLSQEVCKYLAKGLDDSVDVEQAMQAALKQLVHQIPLAGDDILNHGGVYAMVGPTGVGKTTSIAKLAARFAMQHGQRHVALISTDTYRIGAHEQLMTYGRLLGVPVHSANDTQELQQLLHKLHDKKLILIDTAGMSQRDINISQQLAHLSHPSSMIKPYLVLSANAQISTLDEVICTFKKAGPAGCIITKLDEAASLGGVLSAVIKHQLPIAM
jgi:flagellar biosynthesis protein FlhF